MNRLLMLLLAVAMLALPGCVGEGPPMQYAQRAHPECHSFQVLNHRLDSISQTEVRMSCPDESNAATVDRSITIKCIFGWGLLSDTTCHENN